LDVGFLSAPVERRLVAKRRHKLDGGPLTSQRTNGKPTYSSTANSRTKAMMTSAVSPGDSHGEPESGNKGW
jgi:hypothetical protein